MRYTWSKRLDDRSPNVCFNKETFVAEFLIFYENHREAALVSSHLHQLVELV
jgi:hypothetical protein